MLGGGTLLATIGAAMTDVPGAMLTSLFTEEEEQTSAAGPILCFIGVAAMVGSIPLFIAASKNKRKAAIFFSFKMENATQLSREAFVKSHYPAVSFKFRLWLSWSHIFGVNKGFTNHFYENLLLIK